MLGVRVKLASQGSGRWQASGGRPLEVRPVGQRDAACAGELKAQGMLDCLQLLALPPRQPDHQHPHDQAGPERGRAHLRRTGTARRRPAVPRRRRRAGRRLRRLADQLRVERQLHLAGIRQRRGVPHPERLRRRQGRPSDIVQRAAGRWSPTTACWSSTCWAPPGQGENDVPTELPESAEQPLWDLLETYKDLGAAEHARSLPRRPAGPGHDDAAVRRRLPAAGTAGQAENLFWAICRKISRLLRQAEECPRSWTRLDALLADTYFCNFSLFQSLPDSWAINQLFPIMPIHRLDERPTRHAVLADITCDSRRQDRPLHRPARRETHPAAARLATASPTTWAPSWSAPTRRSWATCTTSSATPTPCTSAPTRRATW